MGSIDLATFANAFRLEADLRGTIADLLTHVPNVDDVKITHGAQEYGKDIVFRSRGGLLEPILCACVVKNTKIVGAVDSRTGAMNVLHQVKQCLTHPYLNSRGERERVGRVYVMSPHDCSQTAMRSIEGELHDRAGQVIFVCGHALLSLFETHLPGFLLLQSGLLTKYLTALKEQMDDNSPLAHIAFKHGILAQAKSRTARAYVRPRFHKQLPNFELPHFDPVHIDALRNPVEKGAVRELEKALKTRQALVLSLSAAWKPRSEAGPIRTLATELARFTSRLDPAWRHAYNKYRESCASSDARPEGENQIRLKLPDAAGLFDVARRVVPAVEALINEFSVATNAANVYARSRLADPISALASHEILEHGRVWMLLARPAKSEYIKNASPSAFLRICCSTMLAIYS